MLASTYRVFKGNSHFSKLDKKALLQLAATTLLCLLDVAVCETVEVKISELQFEGLLCYDISLLL